MDPLDELAQKYEAEILNTLKADLGDSWAKLQADVVKDLENCAKTAGKLTIRALKGEDVSSLQNHIQAQMLSLVAIGQDMVVQSFWDSVNKVLAKAGELLGQLARHALKGFTGI